MWFEFWPTSMGGKRNKFHKQMQKMVIGTLTKPKSQYTQNYSLIQMQSSPSLSLSLSLNTKFQTENKVHDCN